MCINALLSAKIYLNVLNSVDRGLSDITCKGQQMYAINLTYFLWEYLYMRQRLYRAFG